MQYLIKEWPNKMATLMTEDRKSGSAGMPRPISMDF